MLTDGARPENVLPPLDLTRISKSCLERNDKSEFLENQEYTLPREINCKPAKHL